MLRLVIFKMNFIFLFISHLLFITLFSVTRLVVRCRSDEFECLDGSCVSQTARCDGRSDCRDRSDEYNCTGIIMFPFFLFRLDRGDILLILLYTTSNREEIK